MKIRSKKLLFFLALILFIPGLASAHQPRLTTQAATIVTDPEISKAYYGQLAGQPHIYKISSAKEFALYVNILVPDIAGQKKDVSVLVINNGNTLAKLNGVNFEWKKFYEPFGRDTYWQGPEYKATVAAGEYEIRVSSVNNDSKYSLAIGETESFDLKESINAVRLIPEIKNNFFNESPAGFIFSPFGAGYVVAMFALAFIFGFIYRLILKRVAKGTSRGLHKNIGKGDRWLRFIISVGLFVFAITTTWNPILLFLAGFCLFESIFSWCGLYAAIGKNTCPL